MARLSESDIENTALSWLNRLGYLILFGSDIAPGMPDAERDTYGQVVLERRLRRALRRLKPQVPPDAMEDAFRRLIRPDSLSLVANNHAAEEFPGDDPANRLRARACRASWLL